MVFVLDALLPQNWSPFRRVIPWRSLVPDCCIHWTLRCFLSSLLFPALSCALIPSTSFSFLSSTIHASPDIKTATWNTKVAHIPRGWTSFSSLLFPPFRCGRLYNPLIMTLRQFRVSSCFSNRCLNHHLSLLYSQRQ